MSQGTLLRKVVKGPLAVELHEYRDEDPEVTRVLSLRVTAEHGTDTVRGSPDMLRALHDALGCLLVSL